MSSHSCARFPNVYAVLLALSLVAASSPMAEGHASWRGPVFAVWLYFPFLLLWGALVSGRGWIQPLVLGLGATLALFLPESRGAHNDAAFGGILLTWTAGVAIATAFIHLVVAGSEAWSRRSATGSQQMPPASGAL